MSFLSGVTHLAGNVAAPLAETAGAVGSVGGLLPNSFANQATALGHNISNPNVTLSNPGGVLSSNNPAFTGAGAYGAKVLGGGSGQSASKPGVAASPSGAYTTDPNAAANAAAAQQTQADLAYLGGQQTDLNSLLGRTQTGLDQGLGQLNSSYQGSVNQQQNQENQALQNYQDQRTQTNKDKLNAYDTINRNANSGYRSLAQLIGHASGSGSSAFQELLPNVIGKDTSSQRTGANDTYATNLGNIDTAQKKTEGSFAQILQDLANQRQAQEQSLRTGVENQRQSIQQQLEQNAALQAQARGGGYAEVAAAQQPYQQAIDNSRNTVEGFFNQFKPTYTAQQAAIAAPDLSQYQTDRSVVNAQQQGASDPTNPYADILRRKLQDGSI